MKETEVLAGCLDNARQLTRFYLSKLKQVDPLLRYKLSQDCSINSYYWIIGHLCWAENLLVLKNLGVQATESYDWLESFSVGQSDSEQEGMPAFGAVLDAFKQIHLQALLAIQNLDEEVLIRESTLEFNFGNGNSVREILKHAIRHESVHTGHLGLICKISGIDTI
jgi:hypothetical protein